MYIAHVISGDAQRYRRTWKMHSSLRTSQRMIHT